VKARLNRGAAYESTSASVTEWQATVKKNRERATLSFLDQERKKAPKMNSLAALAADFAPADDFERRVADKLREKGVATGEDVERGEDLAMHALDPEEARERRGRLAKMRSLLFKHELKAKRVKAIKSKTFHRHNRKTGARVRLLGEDGNPEEEDDGEGTAERAATARRLKARICARRSACS
jgi:Uncharacterized conserved protein